jgi:glycosyltransferase involved in cell wall biosynthesis
MAYPAFAIRNHFPDGPRWVFDAHNAEHLLQRRMFQRDARNPKRWVSALYSWLQWRKLARFEGSICRQADCVLACSPADAGALRGLVPGLQPVLLPNGVDTDYCQPGIVAPAHLVSPSLVFTGKMDFRPNVDAILWFCAHVMPRIRVANPQAHLYVVGKSPHPRLAALAENPGVTLTGFVEDVRPYIAAASVYVVPLLTGGGTRLKVLEALAMGKAIVSTSLGSEGIPVEDGRELLLADEPHSFAQRVLSLLADEPRRRELGAMGRAFAVNRFDWKTVAAPLQELYDE